MGELGLDSGRCLHLQQLGRGPCDMEKRLPQGGVRHVSPMCAAWVSDGLPGAPLLLILSNPGETQSSGIG